MGTTTNALNSVKNTPNRLLHTMLRVTDLERSVAFYRDALGMTELRREDFPDGRFTLSFLGYGNDVDASENGALIELTYNYDANEYSMGNRFGHIALAVPDIYVACDRLSKLGVMVTRAPGPMKFTSIDGRGELIAFIEDPDGYQIELICENHRTR